jgi:very-short-patch-repair endonuclease
MSKLLQHARNLRKESTEAERRLWRELRRLYAQGEGLTEEGAGGAGGLGGSNKLRRFRRQQPIGPYIVDFVCLAAGLVIEVDGGQHGEDEHTARDMERGRWLEAEGYRVLRFWNNEVLGNMEGVLVRIAEYL